MSSDVHLVSFDKLKTGLDIRGLDEAHDRPVVVRVAFLDLQRSEVRRFAIHDKWYLDHHAGLTEMIEKDLATNTCGLFRETGRPERWADCPAAFDKAPCLEFNSDFPHVCKPEDHQDPRRIHVMADFNVGLGY